MTASSSPPQYRPAPELGDTPGWVRVEVERGHWVLMTWAETKTFDREQHAKLLEGGKR